MNVRREAAGFGDPSTSVINLVRSSRDVRQNAVVFY